MENKPQRRHQALQPLSRHHHHALVMAQMLIKQKEDFKSIQRELSDFWNKGGREHFREEEEYLLPEYAKYNPIDRPEIRELLLEHIQIRSLISQVCDDSRFYKMQELGELLKNHVRKEEQIVFPMIEAGIPENSLRRLASFFSEHLESSVFYGTKESEN